MSEKIETAILRVTKDKGILTERVWGTMSWGRVSAGQRVRVPGIGWITIRSVDWTPIRDLTLQEVRYDG